MSVSVLCAERVSQYKYICPECEWPEWFNDAQFKNGKPINYTCGCGKRLRAELPAHLFKEKEVDDKTFSDGVMLEALEILVTYDVPQQEARTRLKKVMRPNLTLSQLVKNALNA